MVRADDAIVDQLGSGYGGKASAVLEGFEPLDDVEVDRRHPTVGVDEAMCQQAGDERPQGDGQT